MNLQEAFDILTGKSQKKSKERNERAYDELMETLHQAEKNEKATQALRNIGAILRGDKPNGVAR